MKRAVFAFALLVATFAAAAADPLLPLSRLGGWYLEGDADDGLFIGYAGPSAGWLFFPDSPVGVSAWLTAGMGGYVRTDAATGDRSEGCLLVLEPEVCAFVAITSSSRIGIGASHPARHARGRHRGHARRPERGRICFAGGISQKFAIVKGQIARYDGVEMVGYVAAGTGEVVGAPAVLVSPKVKGSLVLTDFCRLNRGLALRGTFPVRKVPGLDWLDVSGPTLSVELCFGARPAKG